MNILAPVFGLNDLLKWIYTIWMVMQTLSSISHDAFQRYLL